MKNISCENQDNSNSNLYEIFINFLFTINNNEKYEKDKRINF